MPASEAHAQALADSMRSADAAEVLASGGYEPLGAVLASLRASDRAWTLFVDGEVSAMWGTCPTPRSDTAIVWLLTGQKIESIHWTFVRLAGMVLRGLLRRHAVLVNAIDCRYEAACRWAIRLGAELHPPVPFGSQGLPFRFVFWRRAA